jgi:hypothetical protein
MRTGPNRTEPEPASSKPADAKPPDVASASLPYTLAALHVSPDAGLTQAQVDAGRYYWHVSLASSRALRVIAARFT